MTLDEIVATVASEMDLPKTLVYRTYMSFWKVVKEHIEEIPLKEDMSEEEFKKARTNINIPSLGKFFLTYDNYKKIKQHYKDKILTD